MQLLLIELMSLLAIFMFYLFVSLKNKQISVPLALLGLAKISVSFVLGMGKGPKRTLKLFNYRLESRPLTDLRPRSLGLDLDLAQ